MTERQRDMLAYGAVALAGGALLLWLIPGWSPEYPGYGVPASLLPNIAAGFMLALSLLGLVRAALASRAERRAAAPKNAGTDASAASEGGPAGSAACPDDAPASAAAAAGIASPAVGKAEAGAQGADGTPPSTEEAEKAGACPSAPRVHWLHLARFLIPCVLLMPAMSQIGFIPAGVAFMAVIQYFCGQRRPLAFALVAALPVLAVYAVMRFGLGVPMP